jgi:prevent-host-death family protein
MAKSVYGSRAGENKGPRYSSPTRTFQVAEDIVPIADLKARLSETVRSLDDRARPLVITLNGKPAAVIMSPREYDRLTYRARFVGAIEDGLADADAGRVISDEELGRTVEQRYGTAKPGRRR